MTATTTTAKTETTCHGCGRSFSSARGLRSHQTAKFVALGCKPLPEAVETPAPAKRKGRSPGTANAAVVAEITEALAEETPAEEGNLLLDEYVTAGEGGTVRRVVNADMRFAAEWLDAYESNDPEVLDAMASVAEWLRRKADFRQARSARKSAERAEAREAAKAPAPAPAKARRTTRKA